MAITRRDVAYLLVLAWAFAGIGVKQAAVPLVATTAWIVTALMIFMIFYAVIARKGQASPVPA
jgi:preprotein translocase subunit SecG